MDSIERFWTKVDRSGGPDDCWPWIGGRNAAGYGQFYAHRQDAQPGDRQHRFPAHRWLLGYLRGRELEGGAHGIEEACHRCDNPPCVNPAHLYVGTRRSNKAEELERGRNHYRALTHCPQGHPYDEDNTYTRSSGSRQCRACRAEQAKAAKGRQAAARTHCKHGHPLAGDNLLLCKNGTRKCRTCDAARLAKVHPRE